MPKGSKKRKAANRKKEKGVAAHHHHNDNHTNHNASDSAHVHGDDDLKQHEDIESDAEEVNSPASQDHPNNHLEFTDGEKEEVEKASEDGSSVDGMKVHCEVVEEIGAGIGQALKREDGKREIVEHVSSNTVRLDEESSSNDSKPTNELKSENVTVELVEPIKESGNMHQGQSLDVEAPGVNLTSSLVDEAPLVNSYEEVKSSPEGLPQATEAILAGEKDSLIEENGYVVELDKVASADEKTNGDNIASVVSVESSDVIVPGRTENGEKEARIVDMNHVASASLNLVSENKGLDVDAETDDVLPPSDVKVSDSHHTEDSLMPRSDARNVVGSLDNAEQKSDFKVLESSDSQSLEYIAARPLPRTSWMSCCGLFEVLSGSTR